MTSAFNVIPMRRSGGGEASFQVCPTCDGTRFAVVCRFDNGVPFVAVPVCGGCAGNSETGVVRGHVQ